VNQATVAARLTEVLGRIRAAERRNGRPEGSVALVAVSKRHGAEAIRAAYASPLGPPLAMAAPWTDITSDSRR